MKTKRARAQGVIGTVEEPSGFLADQAKQIQKQRQEQKLIAAANAKPFVMLNKHSYRWLYEAYQARVKAGGSRRLEKCKRCEAVLHWEEPAHVCSGFKPKYVEHDAEWEEKQEARRQAIKEAKENQSQRHPVCSVCGEEIAEFEDGQWHWDRHEGRPERLHQAMDGEPDGDMDGYDDWCDEDESYEEDDGDPMWD
jgi:hypothetical protein